MSNKKKEEQEQEAAVVLFRPNKDLSTLPTPVQEALSRYKTREMVGFAETWKPEQPGEYIIGSVVSMRRETGKYKSTLITLQTPDGAKAVWLGGDLKMKLGEDSLVGRNFVIMFEGWISKKDNPNLKNDMKAYKVVEVVE